VAAVPEQARPLGAQRDDLGDDRARVVLVAAAAAADRRAEDLLAQGAVVQELQRGLPRGQHEREEPAVAVVRRGGDLGGGKHRARQPVQACAVGDVHSGRLGALVELGAEPRAQL
jgi:hypothetical protein